MTDSCQYCKFWDNLPQTKTKYGSYNTNAGMCRRRSPMRRYYGSIDPWPETWSDDWCGEFEDKK